MAKEISATPAPFSAKSRLAAHVPAVVQALSGAGATVKAVAEKVKISERDVRLVIDGLRRKGSYTAVERIGPGTFKIVPPKKA